MTGNIDETEKRSLNIRIGKHKNNMRLDLTDKSKRAKHTCLHTGD